MINSYHRNLGGINMNKHYSLNDKLTILKEYLNGKTLKELHDNYGVSRNTVYSWSKTYQTYFISNLKINLRDYHDLKVKHDRAEKIIEILNKSNCSPNSTLKDKYKAIKELKSEYSETLLCRAFNISKGSYYNHIFRSKNDVNEYVKREEELKPEIEKIFIESNYLYGPGRVRAVMIDRGFKVSERVVARIMHENNWFAARTSSKTLYSMNKKRKENILKQNFTVSKPNEVWVSDVTYFKLNGRVYYICVILDLFARKVISYKLSEHNSTRLVKGCLIEAINSRNPDCNGLLFHSDNGSNFTSNVFTSYLSEKGIAQSFSRPGIPYDNSVVESFFKTLKAEELYIGRYKSKRELEESLKKYIEFYNNIRAHSNNRYSSPTNYEERYWIKHRQKN